MVNRAYKTISNRLTTQEKLIALAQGVLLFCPFWALAIFALAM